MKGLIIVHGTSQDIMSATETTVQIAKAARAAGYFVIDIGGPGSTERSILRGLKRNVNLQEYTPISEIGFPTDYMWDVVSGTLTGSGIDDIVTDVVEAAKQMLEAGVTSIDLVGFSRGAVALTLALERVGKEMGPDIRLPIPIKVCLLDPVPGPYLVPRTATIPSFVDHCLLLTSKHEGRVGFNHLGLSVSPGVRFEGDIIMGVHGDIGGSTQSAMTMIVRDDVARFVGLPTYRLSFEERLYLQLMAAFAPSQYTVPGVAQAMSRRGIGWTGSGEEFQPGTIELPSAQSGTELLNNQLHEIDWERIIRKNSRKYQQQYQNWKWKQMERDLARMQAQLETLKLMQRYRQSRYSPGVVVPTRPVRNRHHQIQYPPSIYYPPSSKASTKMGKLFGVLRVIPK